MPNLKKNIVYSILLTASQVLFSLIILPYITRVLGPANIGRVAFTDSIAQYFIIFASLGIPIYGVREISRAKHDKALLSKLFFELMAILLIATGILVVIYVVLMFTVKEFRIDKQLFYLGLVQLFLSAFIFEWFFQGLENFKFIALRTFFVRLISTIAIIVFVKNKTDSTLYYGILTFTLLGNTILNLFSLPASTSMRLKGLDLKKHLKPIFTFFSTRFVTSVYVILLTVVLGFVSSKESVAFFSSAYKIYTVALTFIIAFSSVLIPRLSDYINRNMHAEGVSLVSKSLHVICSFGIPVVIGVIFFSGQIVHILLGDKFLAARTDLILLSPLILVISISNLFAMNVLTPRNKESKFLRATFLGMCVSLILMYLLLPGLHDVGASVTLLTTECFICVLLGYYSHEYLSGIKLNLRSIIFSLINSIVVFGLAGKFIALIKLAVVYQFIVAISLSSFIYIIIQLFFVKDTIAVEMAAIIKRKIIKR